MSIILFRFRRDFNYDDIDAFVDKCVAVSKEMETDFPVVFCHGDMNIHNLIYEEETGVKIYT